MHTLIPIVAISSMFSSPVPLAGTTLSVAAESTVISEFHTVEVDRLKLGDTIEDFTISTPFSPDDSSEATLTTLLESGPVVLTFFRGSWCPYCRGELSDIQDRIEDFNELGATVIAVSPEIDEKSVEMGEELKLDFFVAHDNNNELARSLGLTFKLDAKTIKKYREYNINVADSNGTGKWELPVPATYVIDKDRTIQYVFDDENYSKRANYKKVLKVVKELVSDG
jgi:peroxiredoxin